MSCVPGKNEIADMKYGIGIGIAGELSEVKKCKTVSALLSLHKDAVLRRFYDAAFDAPL